MQSANRWMGGSVLCLACRFTSCTLDAIAKTGLEFGYLTKYPGARQVLVLSTVSLRVNAATAVALPKSLVPRRRTTNAGSAQPSCLPVCARAHAAACTARRQADLARGRQGGA